MTPISQDDSIQVQIAALLCEEAEPVEFFTRLAEALLEWIPADRFSLGTSVLNRWHIYENGEAVFQDYASAGTIKEGFSASSWVLYNGKPVLRNDLSELRFTYDQNLLDKGYAADLIVPLKIDGQTVGTANFTSKDIDAFSEDHLEEAERIGDLLAICASRIQSRLDRDAIGEISKAVQSATDLDEILTLILTHIHSLGYDRVRVYLIDPDAQTVRGSVQTGSSQDSDFSKTVHDLEKDPYTRQTLQSEAPQIYEAGTETHRKWLSESGHSRDALEGKSEWAEIALRGRGGNPIGKVAVDNALTGRPLVMAHLEQLRLYTFQVAIAIQQARMYHDLEMEVERRSARLQESQRRYRNLFENMQDGAAYHQIVVDDDGNPIDYVFLEANKAFEKLTGLKREEIVGRPVTEVLPDIKASEFDWIGTYGRVALEGGARAFEQYAEPLGRWYDVSAYSPEKGYFVAIFQDVTERRTALSDLRQSEEKLRQRAKRQESLLKINTAVQNMNHPEDLETVLTTCLLELRSLGVNAVTMAVHRILDPETRQVVTYRLDENGLLAAPQRRKSSTITTEWRTKQIGLVGDVGQSGLFRSKFGGHLIKSCLDVPYSLGVISVQSEEADAFSERDVEDLSQVAGIMAVGLSRLSDLEALQARTTDLVESEAKWRSLVQEATDVIMNVDRQGRILFINYTAPGKTMEQMFGTHLHEFTDPAYHATINASLKKVFEQGHYDQVETRGIDEKGRMVWYLSRVSPIVQDGTVT